MVEDPIQIPFSAVKGALESVGIQVDGELKSVTIEAGCITVTRFRLDGEGRRVVIYGHNDLATVTRTISMAFDGAKA